jgi:4-amino-4-deoxy-L-arabinose transferase-like glycosyltransferase
MAAPRSRLAAAVPGWGWLLLAGCYVAQCWATIVTRTQWVSDSRLYLAWSYRYLGYSRTEAAHRTRDFLIHRDGVRGCTFCWPPGYEHGYFSGPNGAVVGARPLYPLLSAPFVALFGPEGMLVVPVASFALAIVLIALLAHRLWGRHWGLMAGLLLLIPATVSRFAVYGMTESLAVALTVAAVLFLPLARAPRRRDLLWFGVLLVLGLCVRQFAIALTAGVVLAWLVVAARERSWANGWWRHAAVAVGASAATLAAQSAVTSVWFGGAALDLTGRYQRLTCQVLGHCGASSVPWGLRYIGRPDYGVLRGDLALLAVVVLGVVAVVRRRRSELTALTVGAALATVALNLLVVWPSYYRYLVPIQPLIVLTGLALVADLAARPRRAPARSTEVAPPRPGAPGPAPGPVARRGPAVSLAGWTLCGLTFLGAVAVVWRRDRPTAGAGLLALSCVALAATFVVLVSVVAGRFGATAGVLAGLGLALSGAVIGRGLVSWRDAVLLGAGTGAVALAPWGGTVATGATGRTGSAGSAGSAGGGPGRGVRFAGPVGFAGLAATATAVAPAGAGLAAGAVAGWLAACVRERRAGNRWAAPAAGAAAATVVVLAARIAANGLLWHPPPVQRLVAADFRTLAADRVLYLTCLVAAVAVPATWRRPASWYAAGSVGLTALVHAGFTASPGIGDFLVAYPALLYAVAAALAAVAQRSGRRAGAPPAQPGALSGTPTTGTPRS